MCLIKQKGLWYCFGVFESQLQIIKDNWPVFKIIFNSRMFNCNQNISPVFFKIVVTFSYILKNISLNSAPTTALIYPEL